MNKQSSEINYGGSGSDIHGPQWTNPDDSGVPLNFPLSSRLVFLVWSKMSHLLLDGRRLYVVQMFMVPRG